MIDNGTDNKKGSGSKGGKFFSAFCSVIGTVGVILIILLCIPVTIPHFLGFDIYNVISGSMEPKLPVGSIVYVKSADCEELVTGDIIAFNSNGMTVTHRVVKNDTELKEIITKGDANVSEDPTPVKYGSVIGKIKLHLPLLGGFSEFFTSFMGKIYLMGILAACFVLMMIGGSLKDKNKKKAVKSDDDED